MNWETYLDLMGIKIPGLEYPIDDTDTTWADGMENKKTLRLNFVNETKLCRLCKNARGSKECRSSNCSQKRQQIYKEANK